MKKTEYADVQVISRPVAVELECPHCEKPIKKEYSEFCDMMGGDPPDWEYTRINCEHCDNMIEIDKTEWL